MEVRTYIRCQTEVNLDEAEGWTERTEGKTTTFKFHVKKIIWSFGSMSVTLRGPAILVDGSRGSVWREERVYLRDLQQDIRTRIIASMKDRVRLLAEDVDQ